MDNERVYEKLDTAVNGALVKSVKGTIDFESLDVVPTGSTIPDTVNLTVGTENQLNFSFTPDGVLSDGYKSGFAIIDGCDYDLRVDGHTFYIAPKQTGTFEGMIRIETENAVILKGGVTFNVN